MMHNNPMPLWQQKIKRLIDIVLSLSGAIILSPIIILNAIIVVLTSRGPLFFLQEREGYKEKTFMIWKFRSMHVSAEAAGPQLSSDEDSRSTAWGKIMRKWRMDELPQFWNVLKGDMSIVGPRPERRFFIDQIIQTNPEYLQLLNVKPGLTSLGIIKLGYAENVDEMIKRMKYDLEYIKHISLWMDFKIMVQSIQVILGGKGK